MNNVEILSLIKQNIPNQFAIPIHSISLQDLATKYTDSVWPRSACTNVVVRLSSSAYILNPIDFTLCKLINGMIYFPALGSAGVFDPNCLPSDFQKTLVNQLESSYSPDSFGCCGSYLQCSNEKHCIHENPYYASGCMYKKNLDAGKIFYGVNRNV